MLPRSATNLPAAEACSNFDFIARFVIVTRGTLPKRHTPLRHPVIELVVLRVGTERSRKRGRHSAVPEFCFLREHVFYDVTLFYLVCVTIFHLFKFKCRRRSGPVCAPVLPSLRRTCRQLYQVLYNPYGFCLRLHATDTAASATFLSYSTIILVFERNFPKLASTGSIPTG